MSTTRPGPALAVGWVFGFVASVVGLLGSVKFDLPAAPSILVTLTVLLVAHGALIALLRIGRAPIGLIPSGRTR
jgi:ABC-type Mn2+/Zn2+ transport system permease subunit